MNGQVLNTPLIKIKRSKSVHEVIVRKTLNTAWRAKIYQKKTESLQKSQSEIAIVNQKQEVYNGNKSTCKSLGDLKKYLLDQNQHTQNRINNLIRDIQNIRRSSEKVHQETLKMFAKTENIITDTAAYRKEQGELQREVERLNKETNSAMRLKYTKEDEYFDMYDIVESMEKRVKGLKKTLGFFEGERNAFIDTNRKTLKKIDEVAQEIKRIMKAKRSLENEYN